MPSPLDLFALPETLGDDHLLATYVLELPVDVDPLARATRFAVGQTTGTWLPVPGITDELRARHEARVVGISSLPPADTRGSPSRSASATSSGSPSPRSISGRLCR